MKRDEVKLKKNMVTRAPKVIFVINNPKMARLSKAATSMD